MTFMLTVVFVLLMIEFVFVSFMPILWFGPQTWRWLFGLSVVNSVRRFLKKFAVVSIALAVLFLIFLDSIRECVKYSSASEDVFHWDEQKNRLWCGQRNMYLSGSAFYLLLVARSMMELVVIVPAPDND